MTKTKTKTKIKHDYVCDICGKPATYNKQDGGCKLFAIDDDGEYELEDEWGNGDTFNEFYCDNCLPE